MRSIAIVAVLALGTTLALCAATPAKNVKKKTAAKKTATKSSSVKSKAPATATATASKSKGTKSKSTAGKTKSKAGKTQTVARFRRSTQKEPAPERYKEIQQSLANKGYFGGPVDGTWGPGSVEALKRFQRDQNIGDDGKLGSLSLIALGLGPKRGAGGAENPGAGLPPP